MKRVADLVTGINPIAQYEMLKSVFRIVSNRKKLSVKEEIMSLSSELEKLKYDKRLMDWNVSRGRFPKEELKKYLL